MKCQKKKKLATRYQCMKAFFHQKVDKKPNILELIHTQKHRLTFAHVMRHAILFLQHIFWYCSTMLLLSVCLRLSDDKFQENNVLTCPASYSYYSPITTMEWRIIFIRQIMDNFKNTVRLVMHMLRFQSTDPCTKTRRAC